MKSADRSANVGLRSLAAVARIGGFVAFVVAAGAAIAGLFAQGARAEMDETFLRLGSDLTRLRGVTSEGTREVQLNGARISFSAHSVEMPLGKVLDHYEEICQATNAVMFDALGDLVHGPVVHAATALGAIATSSVRRADRGYVACADFGSSSETIVDRIFGLSLANEWGEVGRLRYVYAQRGRNRGHAKTFVFAMWTSSGAFLHRLVPSGARDAEGRDVPGIPRPRDTRRILSAWEVGGPSGIFTYVTKAHSAREIESFYRVFFDSQGWKILERHEAQETDVDHVRMISAERSQRLVTVLAHPDPRGRTIITILVSEPS